MRIEHAIGAVSLVLLAAGCAGSTDDGTRSNDIAPHTSGDAGPAGSSPDAGSPLEDAGPVVVVNDSGAAEESYRQVVLDDHPVLYYRLGESSAAQPSKDEVAAAAQGTYAGTLTLGQPGAIAGDPNTAAALSGGYLDVGNVFPFAGSAPFSIEAWVASSGSPNYQEIVIKRDFDATTQALSGYHLFLGTDGSVCVQRWNGTGSSGSYDTACSSTPASTGTYTHVVATYDVSILALYMNGAIAASTPSVLSLPVTHSPLRIGGDPFFAQSSFNGRIDEVALYDHALTPARVAAHTQAGRGP